MKEEGRRKKEEGRRKKEEGIRRFIYGDWGSNSKRTTCVLVGILKSLFKDKNH
ncbi:MAG: hypothetical protein KME60_09425 [Cyanomargarita calcarea GSE-NOS-MK-12-04C]|jgi:hypothetical protein|uniref:Uncharacterized protein n=1 Tax=Cyanomargarita calcarea GSE-NOS-MK-12-04C TaxID=2839659 RepID=A0A951QL11_9CYAN|nr:hypothetical protein [Cyanomargarita calcarea GSE-NOS-MK-12-04C]